MAIGTLKVWYVQAGSSATHEQYLKVVNSIPGLAKEVALPMPKNSLYVLWLAECNFCDLLAIVELPHLLTSERVGVTSKEANIYGM